MIHDPSQGDRRSLLWLAAVFAVSRVAFYAAGVRFDDLPLVYFWQYLDLEALRTDLWRSLLYQHSQPPLFNLLLGVITKLAPANEGFLLAVLYRGLGLVLALGLFQLMRALEVGRRTAFWVTLAVVISPATILYENFAFYTYPVTAILVASALTLHRFLMRGRTIDGVAFFSILAVIALTRSLFHLVWVLAVSVLVLVVSKWPLRTIAAAALVPVLVVTAAYLKNVALFGFFGVSSWLGMNLSIVTTFPLDYVCREELIAEGSLSSYARIPPFRRPEAYGLLTATTGIPVLDMPTKTGGQPNFNHIGYVEISRHYLRDALRALTIRPDGALRGVLSAISVYFRPANEYWFVRHNRERIRSFDAAFATTYYGWPGYRDDYVRPESGRPIMYYVRGLRRMSPTFVVLYGGALWIGLAILLRGIRRRQWSAAESTLIYVCGTILWITVFGITLDVRENNRFRFPSEPLAVAAVAVGITRWKGARKRREEERVTDALRAS